MTTIKVDWYKPGGKWYTDTEFTTAIGCWNSAEIEDKINDVYTLCEDMSYTYEASSTEGINKRMVIKSQN